MKLTALVLCALATISIVLNLWQWVAARRFPIRAAKDAEGDLPRVSVLKPLKGRDAETERCLESWFQQEYGAEFELLFGVASAEDPVCEIVLDLQKRYPQVKSDLVIAYPILGPNAKVSSLCYISRKARHEHLVISDADVFVKKDFLSNLVAEMRDESVGLVNCFYILSRPSNVAMKLEAVAVNADFWSQVLQGVTLRRIDFALGAVMATTRSDLEKIGGFECLLDYLADDYQLGNRIAQTGRKLVICPVPVECRSDEHSPSEVWRHQLRWGRTIRFCRPAGYFFSVLSNGTLWPALALIFASRPGAWVFVAGLMLRMLAARSNYQRLTRSVEWWVAPLAPVKDLLHVPVWISSFLGNGIAWRGKQFRVHEGGKLTPSA